jgi:hypothetical protein
MMQERVPRGNQTGDLSDLTPPPIPQGVRHPAVTDMSTINSMEDLLGKAVEVNSSLARVGGIKEIQGQCYLEVTSLDLTWPAWPSSDLHCYTDGETTLLSLSAIKQFRPTPPPLFFDQHELAKFEPAWEVYKDRRRKESVRLQERDEFIIKCIFTIIAGAPAAAIAFGTAGWLYLASLKREKAPSKPLERDAPASPLVGRP